MVQDINPMLAAIIAPGTDQDVIEQYATLAKRAQVRDFGLLEDDVVIIDTETTGLDFKECEIIEVAAARLCGRDIIDTMDLFVRPAKPIPAEITAITGIDNEMVADADDAATVAHTLAEFVGDAPVVAHNAMFDHHFIEAANGGVPIGDVWIDSLELSRIVLPCLTSHKLHDLSGAFDLYQSTHRALDDVIATCGLWRVLLTAASDLPAGLICALADMYPSVAWSYRPIFAQLAAEHPQTPFSLVDERTERCGKGVLAPRGDALERADEGELVYPSPNEVAAAFSSVGLVGRMYDDYEPRAEQAEMARVVAQTFRQNGVAAIEAGTGVGKSIAYLLPAALLAQRNDITVGVATKTNALADQLINHELPLLSDALDRPLTYTVLKGYDNYPCLRKIDRLMRRGAADAPASDETASDDQSKLPQPSSELLDALAAILAYAVQSSHGDINCLGIRWGKIRRSDVTCAASECQKRRCPYFPTRCFLHLARRRAAASDIVVTNHALLFRQIATDIEVLPPIRFWVVDEAHSAASEARHQWALRVNSHDVAAAFDIMGGSASGALGGLMKEVRTRSDATLLLGQLSKAVSECSRASIASGLFFDDLKAFCRKQLRGKKALYESESIWIDAEMRSDASFAKVRDSGQAFADILEHAVSVAQEAIQSVSAAAGDDQRILDRLGELAAATGDLETVYEALTTILDGTDTNYVYSAQANQRTGLESYEVVAECLDVGRQLAESWYPETRGVVYSSATIAVGERFDHFAHEVGLDLIDEGSYRAVRLDSSYDFDAQMRIIVADDLPDPSRENDAYLEALAPLLIDIHRAMDGSVLTLFTSRSEMDRMYALVQPELARQGLELMAQPRGGNLRRLRDHFVAEPNSSLFALKSFWEGFDARGETLRCVVIPRLPFAPPTDPLSRERRVREGRDAWRNHDLPESVLAMKQAAGRLIRSSTDTGVLVLADPRLTTMWYGNIFLASLPKHDFDRLSIGQIGDALRAWKIDNM